MQPFHPAYGGESSMNESGSILVILERK